MWSLNKRVLEPTIPIKKWVINKLQEVGTKFFDLLAGYSVEQEEYINAFFIQRSSKNNNEGFLNTCSHREFYEFIQLDPWLRKVFLLKFKERIQYPDFKKDTSNHIGEFRVKKVSGAWTTLDRFKITDEDEIFYKIQMHIFKIPE